MSGESKIPQNRTFRKDRKGNKGRIMGTASRGYKLTKGEYGLKALDSYKLTAQQIMAMRMAIVRHLKSSSSSKDVVCHINVFPHKPISAKPIGTRMGGGKSSVDHWVCIVKPGKILFEVTNSNKDNAKRALQLAAAKIPIKTRFITEKESI